MTQIARIRIHPVKSCRGYDVAAADLDELGVVGDRRFQVVAPDGKPYTQRTHRQLARVETELTDLCLQLNCADIGQCRVSRDTPPDTEVISTEVWNSTGLQAHALSPEADAFFSEVLQQPARLVTIGAAFDRPVKHNRGHRVGFADAYPLLVVSESSLADLNDRLRERGAEPLEMERFRPNLILSGSSPYAEDEWVGFSIGHLNFRATGPCERCIMTTLDPLTGERTGPEPLATLATYRRSPTGSGVLFGQNMINESVRGSLSVGDEITPLLG